MDWPEFFHRQYRHGAENPVAELYGDVNEAVLVAKYATEQKGRKLMFKGLSPYMFSEYFAAGGITPHQNYYRHMRVSIPKTITNDWKEAKEYSHGTFGRSDGVCFAIITANPFQQEYGDYTIPWQDVKLVLSRRNLHRIKDQHRKNQSAIPWEDFRRNVVLVPSRRDKSFCHGLIRALRM